MADPKSRSVKRIILRIAFIGFWLWVLFGGAGTIYWLRGWIFVLVASAGMAGLGAAIKRFNPALMEARMKWRHANTKPFDRVILAVYLPLTLIQPALAGIDAVRFGWTSMPFWTVYAGAALYIAGFALMGWIFAVNPYAETTVRIQTERGHTVVDSGPYRFVRHPMYVAIVIMHVAAPLILGSWWSLSVALPIALLFIVRTALEDRALRSELAGYDEYAGRTPYRLVPGVW